MKIGRNLILFLALIFAGATAFGADPIIKESPVPEGAHPHDVAPAVDGGVWYTAQRQGALGYLDPKTGKTRQIPLGKDSSPHGVIVGPDGAPWITDSGMNAIVRVDPKTDKVNTYPLPIKQYASLNTATFDLNGTLWFTGQNGTVHHVQVAYRQRQGPPDPRPARRGVAT